MTETTTQRDEVMWGDFVGKTGSGYLLKFTYPLAADAAWSVRREMRIQLTGLLWCLIRKRRRNVGIRKDRNEEDLITWFDDMIISKQKLNCVGVEGII